MIFTSKPWMRKYAPTVLRISLALVFLWFGVTQLVNPESFIGYVPQWLHPHAIDIVHDHPFQFAHNIKVPSLHFLIITNGIIEVFFGTLLIIGFKTRIAALVLSVHLLIIAIGLGYNDIAVRDFGLALATFSVFLNGPDSLTVDKMLENKKNAKK